MKTKYFNLKKKINEVVMVRTSLLFLITISLFLNSCNQRNDTSEALNTAKSNEIALHAFLMLAKDPTLAFRLAEQAYDIFPGKYAQQVIMAAYTETPYFYNVITKHDSTIRDAQFSTDGNYILTQCADNTSRLLDLSGKIIADIGDENTKVYRSNFLPNSKQILSYHYASNSFHLWDYSGKLVNTFKGHNAAVTVVNYASSGSHLISGAKDSTVIVWSKEGDIQKKIQGFNGVIRTARFSPDDKWILVSTNNSETKLFDLQGNELTSFQNLIHKANYSKFSPNVKFILTHDSENEIMIWDYNGNVIQALNMTDLNVAYATFSPDGNKLVVRLKDYSAMLWDIENDKFIPLKGHTAPISFIEFSQDGNTIATCSEDQSIRLWDLQGGCMGIINHNDHTLSVRFSPDGKYLATGHGKGTVNIWKIDLGKSIALKGANKFTWDNVVSNVGAIASSNEVSEVLNKINKEKERGEVYQLIEEDKRTFGITE